ncbi:MAG: hypothetical protein ABW152_09310 [Candidatus Thiodiazotropha endolucinida]
MDYEIEMGEEMLRLYKSKSSNQYAIYLLILGDLGFVKECLTELKSMIDSTKDAPLLSEALFNAALSRLYSCFDGNKALKNSVLDGLPDGAKEVL